MRDERIAVSMVLIAILISICFLIILNRDLAYQEGYLLGYSDAKAGFINHYREEPNNEHR